MDEFSPTTGLVQIIAAVIGLVGTIFMGLTMYFIARMNVNQKLAELKSVADKTHNMVNGTHGATLMLHMISAQTLATLTKDPQHIKDAELAAKMLAAHEAAQSAG